MDYKVDAKKLKQVFKLAGRVISVDLSTDKDGNSRGFAVVEYDHPVEAVQSISMFDHQMLYDRRMTVRLDRIIEKEKLPEGLGGIGMGLGPNGEPLRNVALNLPSLQSDSKIGGNSNNTPNPVQAPSSLSSSVLNNNSNAMAALSNVVNLSNLNPLLSTLSSLANSGGATGDTNNSGGLDLSKIVGTGSGSVGGLSSGNLGSAGVSSNFSSLSSRLDSSGLSNSYSGNYSNLTSGLSSGRGNANTYSSVQRSNDYDLSSGVRGYNSQNDDYSRLSSLQNFSSSQLGNSNGSSNTNSSNIRSQNISDTILIRNVSKICISYC